MLLITNSVDNPFVLKLEENFKIKALQDFPTTTIDHYSICILILGNDQEVLTWVSKIRALCNLPILVQVKKETIGLELLKKQLVADYFVGDSMSGFIKALDRLSRKQNIQKLMDKIHDNLAELHKLWGHD
jgi:hypothetical protein